MKRLIFIAVALFAAASCAEEIASPVNPEGPAADAMTFEASVDGAATKTLINNGSSYWNGTEEIHILDGGAKKLFRAEGLVMAETATFAETDPSVKFTGDDFMAVYPASSAAGASWSGDVSAAVSDVVIPTVQTASAGTFDPAAHVAMAYTTDNTLAFKNAVSLIKFTVNDDNVSEVIFKTKGGEKVSGSFNVSYNDGVPSVAANASASSSVTLTGDIVKGGTYYIAIAPVALSAGFIIEFKINGGLYWKESKKAYTFGRNKIVNLGGLELYRTFTCAALNVDGLPSIANNSDGPGSSGTTTLGQKVNALGWDFIAVSEDFEYHDELAAAMTNYSSGAYRGSVGIAQLFGSKADTDGLGFFWKKNSISLPSTPETAMVEFNDKEGGLTSGANTCIKKGFRHYEVTVAEGITIDVYITHMNTYSGSGNTESNAYVKAVLSQLRQMRDYVLARAAENNRPAIIMGDTNMRYTRHDIATNFINPVTEAGYTVADPWVEFHRPGYPSWNSRSLMTRAMFKGDKENDICCADDQKGEVVDKVWYINHPDFPVRLKALSCMNDVENFTKETESVSYSGVWTEDSNYGISTGQTVSYTKNVGLADHFPVVVEFTYTVAEPEVAEGAEAGGYSAMVNEGDDVWGL